MSAWFVSMLFVVLVEAVCIAALIGVIALTIWRYKHPKVSETSRR